jgi:hypothetical protein
MSTELDPMLKRELTVRGQPMRSATAWAGELAEAR